MKYFNEDSLERTSVRRKPASTYVAMESISRPRNTITKSPAEAINIMPQVANNSSEWNSPAGSFSPSIHTDAIRTVRIETMTKMSVKLRRNSSSTIMPLNAARWSGAAAQSQSEEIPAAIKAMIDSPPVSQRWPRREKASTIITITPATLTITSGAISEKLISGLAA